MAAVVQLFYDTLTWLHEAVDPPRRPRLWVAIVLFTVTVWALPAQPGSGMQKAPGKLPGASRGDVRSSVTGHVASAGASPSR
jgi:hypothetical protein